MSILNFSEIKTKVSVLQQYQDSVAVIGMSCRFPGGSNNPEEFWKLLEEGREGRSEIDRFDLQQYDKIYTRYLATIQNYDISKFDADFFGISPREAEEMDPQQRILLEVVWEALEKSGIDAEDVKGILGGVFIGVSTSDHSVSKIEHDGYDQNTLYSSTGTTLSGNNGRVSYTFGMQGPSVALDTACSSSLVATHLACQSLLNGDSDLAISGGTHLILTPNAMVSFCDGNMLSPDGRCKTFDASANGYLRGEG